MLNSDYVSSIISIANFCSRHKILFTLHPLYDGLQIRFPGCYGDMICHSGSYGHSFGHVESYAFPWDEGDATELTIDEAKKKLLDYYSHKE